MLAQKGQRLVSPNPMVGAVLVVDEKIIGEGYHQKYGGPHAEVMAIQSVQDQSLLSKATLYVNLEPCSHFGKTPPCADLVLHSKIPRVVIGAQDPNPKVNGAGISRLRQAGVDVTVGILETECRSLNHRFYTNHLLKRPYVILKWAETSDGYISRGNGVMDWISSEESRKLSHAWRAEEDAILVGTETARTDNPELTVRHVMGMNPTRVVIDRRLSLPHNLKLFDRSVPTIVVNETVDREEGSLRFLQIPFGESFVPTLLSRLLDLRLASLIVEGGGKTLQSFFDAGAWDTARVFRSPTIFGSGVRAPRIVEDPKTTKQIGSDLLFTFTKP